MGSELQTYSLSDLGKIVTGKTPPAKIKTAYAEGHGTLFVTPRDMDGRRWIDSTERYLSGEGLLSVQRNLVPSGSIAVSCIGSDMGKAILVKDNSVTNQQINSLLVDKTRFNPLYVYYVLSTKQQYLKDIAGGSATPILNKTDFGKVTIQLPLKAVQDEIANLLDVFDSKIELNRQINQTLEQMAQTLFKSWFVDFDPVMDNALDAGNPIPDELQHRAEARKAVRESEGFKPLPDEVRQLFPDAFEESELGWVPKGWGVGCLANIASYTSNRVATTTLSLNNYVSTENMLAEKKGIVEAANLPTVNTVPAYTTGNVLISNIRPYFKKIWMANGDGGHSNDVLGFQVKEQNTEGYLFNLLYQDALFEFMMTTAKGSKMPRGDKKAILDWQLVIPPYELREYFSLRVGDFYVSSSKRTEENKTLTKLRDTLLPKLISGELRLDDVELAVEQEAVSAEQQNER
ncbi:restriction endonuclease subunit S [Vibrio cholerae]